MTCRQGGEGGGEERRRRKRADFNLNSNNPKLKGGKQTSGKSTCVTIMIAGPSSALSSMTEVLPPMGPKGDAMQPLGGPKGPNGALRRSIMLLELRQDFM